MPKNKLFVAVSLDVEEEGLFSGKYATQNLNVENVALLQKLHLLTTEFNLPLTLFCTHAVFSNVQACRTLAIMRDDFGAEIGAHLHHWSTPPLMPEQPGPPERTDKLNINLFKARLQTLLQAGENFQGKPLTSFRMGRWDLKAQLLPVLAQNGILVDSSVCPLRAVKNGPNHFLAPADPYWIKLAENKRILEAPITQIPLLKSMPILWQKLAGLERLDSFHFFGALSANPFWHHLAIMKLATLLHVRRGGKVLSLFWHSSEMKPGASPHMPDEQAQTRALNKILSFCRWLAANFNIQGITATQLAELNFPETNLQPGRDW